MSLKRFSLFLGIVLVFTIFTFSFSSALICNPQISGGCPTEETGGNTFINQTIQNNTYINQTANLTDYLWRNGTNANQDVNIGDYYLLTEGLKSHDSHGLYFITQSGSPVASFGLGGGQGWTFYDGVKLNASTPNRVLVTDANNNIVANITVEQLNSFVNLTQVYSKSEVYNKTEVDNLLTGLFTLYFWNNTSPYNSSFTTMNITRPSGAFINTTTTVTTDGQILAERLGAPNLTLINHGAFIGHTYVQKGATGGTKDLKIYGELYRKYPNNTEVLLLTTAESATLSNGVDTNIELVKAVVSEIPLNVTDFLVWRLRARLTGVGANPTISVKIQDGTDAGIDLPITLTDITFTEVDPLSLHLDQTTPQTVSGGIPIFSSGIEINDPVNVVRGIRVDDGVTIFGADDLVAFDAITRAIYSNVGGSQVLSIDASNRVLTDTAGASSVDWDNRLGTRSDGTSSFYWGDPGLKLTSKDAYNNYGSVIIYSGSTYGNARGFNSVDIQSFRSATTQVCSGNQSVCIGLYNSGTSLYTVAIGRNNNVGSAGNGGAVAVGTGNTVQNQFSTAFGISNNVGGYNNAHAFGYGISMSGGQSFGLGNNLGSIPANTGRIGHDNNNYYQYTTAGTFTVYSSSANRFTVSTTAITNAVQMLGISGSSSAPSYAFSADTNNGIYRIAEDRFGIATNGTLRVEVNNNQTLFSQNVNATGYNITATNILATTDFYAQGSRGLSYTNNSYIVKDVDLIGMTVTYCWINQTVKGGIIASNINSCA